MKHKASGNGFSKPSDVHPHKAVGGSEDQASKGLKQFAVPVTNATAVTASPVPAALRPMEQSKVNGGSKAATWHQPQQRGDVRPDGGVLHVGPQQASMVRDGPHSHAPGPRMAWGQQPTFVPGVSTQQQSVQVGFPGKHGW